MDHDRKTSQSQSGAPGRDAGTRQGAGATLHLTETDEAAEARSGDEAEMRMRQALGLFGTRPRHEGATDQGQSGERRGSNHMQAGARRHRFVQDGEVPVSVVRGRRDQQGGTPRYTGGGGGENGRSADDEIANERAGREHAERRLAEAQTTIHTLQTRLGMAELERDEANQALKRHLEERAAAALPAPPPATHEPDTDGDSGIGIGIGIRRDTGDDADAADARSADDGIAALAFRDETGPAGADPRGRNAAMRRAPRDLQRRSALENGTQPELPSLEPEPVKWWLP